IDIDNTHRAGIARRQLLLAERKTALIPEDTIIALQICQHNIQLTIAIQVIDRQPGPIAIKGTDRRTIDRRHMVELVRYKPVIARLRRRSQPALLHIHRNQGHLWRWRRTRPGELATPGQQEQLSDEQRSLASSHNSNLPFREDRGWRMED